MNLGIWFDLHAVAVTTFKLTVLKLDGVCKLLMKWNIRIKVKMCRKKQRVECTQWKKKKQILIWRVHRKVFNISGVCIQDSYF